ncbi:adenylate kinase, partial [Listeria monocytogenes]|nr:adenylate kinase [Listeria monocytogenes]
ILAYYKEKGLLQSIDGDRDIDAVFKDVKNIID